VKLKLKSTAFSSGKFPPLPPEFAEQCRAMILWSYWAESVAIDVLEKNGDGFAQRVAEEPEFAATVVEIYKMLRIDEAHIRSRQAITEQIHDRFFAALFRGTAKPGTPPSLGEPIDFERIPQMGGIDAEEINELRPDTQRPRYRWLSDR